MNARQDCKSRTLLLKPPRKEVKSIQTIVYNVKEGRKESLELETSEDEWSTEDSSSTAQVTSSVSDSKSEKASLLEAMGVVLTRPTTQDGGSIKETLSDEKIEDMLSTDLSKEERKEFEVMLQKHSPLFILDFKQIKGATVVEHQINLKPESQPIAHRLRRLERLQQDGFTTEKDNKFVPHLEDLYKVEESFDNAIMEFEPPIPPQETKPKSVGYEMSKAKVVEMSTQRNIELKSQKSVQAKTAAQETNNLEIQLDDQIMAKTTDDARSRSQFLAPIPEIDEPWTNELWEAIRSAKDGSATFQSAPITEVNMGHEVYQVDIQFLNGDAGTEVSIESKPESLKTLPSYIGEHEAKSETRVVPSQRKAIPKMMDTKSMHELMSAPIQCTITLFQLLKIRPYAWDEMGKHLEKMGLKIPLQELPINGQSSKTQQEDANAKPVPINKVGENCEGEEGNTTLPVEYKGVKTLAILDSGAGVAIATNFFWEKWGRAALRKTRMKLQLADGYKEIPLGKPASKKKAHSPHEGSPSKEREGSTFQDESTEDVAPRRRRAQRSPTPPKQKRSPHSPHRHESKREEKSSKKKKDRKRSSSSPSSSPSSSSNKSSGDSSQENQRRGH
ncbi:hypothetical protein L7F22_032543 [Adiantum nelumboides]|nr:hypothetical protein [Adiantum nelumboides]